MLMKLPVIVAMGGMNAAGRSSSFHAYKRMVHTALSAKEMQSTWNDLAHRMGLLDLSEQDRLQAILNGTLIRQIDIFDPNKVYGHQSIQADAPFHVSNQVISEDDKLFIAMTHKLLVQSAGMIPKGFDPASLYSSHHHPRGLSLAVYGMSDALASLGIDWEQVLQHIHPDQVSVYAGSALGQIDQHSLAGLVGQGLKGKRANSKMMPLSLAEMPADFINSYVINSVGSTGHNMGACATFLYNLRQGIRDIQHGYAKVAIVGSAEAAVEPDIIDGFRAMSALATDESLCHLDKVSIPNYRRACRPFSTNTGFVIAESAQFAILMSDDLALALGAPILGSVPDVFVNADGNKKSISSPGVGNYITVAKAVALAKSILGEEGLTQTYVHAHGTGTPQNRVTESHILNEVAKTFGLEKWRICAIKSYIGHSIGVAGGDQISTALGAFAHGILPGIQTIDHIADDVHRSHLDILRDHVEVKDMKASLINAKGFGGNNASALILSPEQSLKMMTHKYGQTAMHQYHDKAEKIRIKQHEIDADICNGKEQVIYHFGNQMMGMDDVEIGQTEIKLKNSSQSIELQGLNPYIDYIE
ncbi:MAG: beta-ketoacyl synthase [Gammaproteobacteria bacterium]|nr:beta-ketoacyl synthase [Gammaproteobacteria bacterium]